MPKKIDITGQQFGEWKVLEEVPRIRGEKGSVKWKCQCSCGKIQIIPGNTLRSGKSTKCLDCKNKKMVKDMTGQTTLTNVYVIERVKSDNNEAAWRCKCPECGRTDWIVKGNSLRKGVTMCQKCSSLKNLSKIEEPFFKDITGQRFGKLIALEKTSKKNKTYYWKCKCDCGNICEKELQYLLNGDTKSCGCLNRSYGEEKVEKILIKNNIPYIREKAFSNLPLKRFDFYINDSYIIEIDGRQHFKYSDSGYGKDLENIHQSDLEKNKYCFDNNIPIIRIPFDKIKEICYNDIILENNNFLITKENENEYYNRYM